MVYGRSLYAGAANANTKLAGEVIGILAGPDPAEVESGLRACTAFIGPGGDVLDGLGKGRCRRVAGRLTACEQPAAEVANADDSILYFAHTVSRTGTYLSKTAGVQEGAARQDPPGLPGLGNQIPDLLDGL